MGGWMDWLTIIINRFYSSQMLTAISNLPLLPVIEDIGGNAIYN